MSTVDLTEDERAYVLGRLDREHLAEIAAQVRRRRALGEPVEVCYMPGDGSWYSLLFVWKPTLVGAPGGGTGGNPPHRWWNGSLIVYGQRGTVTHLGYAYEYVASKLLEGGSPASQIAIAELLKAVMEG